MIAKLKAKAFRTPKNGENFMFPVADETVKLSGGDHGIRKSTLIRDQPVRNEDSVVIFEEVRTGISQWTK